MILGFAHLALSSADADETQQALAKRGWALEFSALGVPSSPAKWGLLSTEARFHDLHVLKGPVTLEIVVHDTGVVAGSPSFDISAANEIIMRTMDPLADQGFLQDGLGFKRDGSSLSLVSRFPGWSTKVILSEDKTPPPPLDVDGYSCVAFYSTNIHADLEKLVELGGQVATEIFDAQVNGRNLKVAMVRAPGGAIIELIKVQRQ